MRKLMTTAAALALAASGLALSPASAASAAYCNPTAAGSVTSGATGSVTYAPPVVSTTVPVLTHWTVKITLFCTAGTAPATGTFYLEISGTSSEICANGGGGGSVSAANSAKTAGVGAGPVANGSWTYTRAGIHYYGYPGAGDGDIYVQETPVTFHHYKVYMWLDLIPTIQNGACPGAGGQLTGHAMITEP